MGQPFLSVDVAPSLIWLTVLPILLSITFLRHRLSKSSFVARIPLKDESYRRPTRMSRVFLFVGSSLFGLGIAAGFGEPVHRLPPAFHDEYSYLFQAETFLAGRVVWPSPPEARHFEQMHVLHTHGIFASRYFPAVGVWLAPFVYAGHPFAAAWLAHALTTGFMALAASRISLLAGVLVAVLVGSSPGLVVFGNTLLSPTVAMMGLAIGWWAFQETFDTGKHSLAFLTGIAIAWVFLGRPLTAVAVAGPWGLYATIQAISGKLLSRTCLVAMIIGFLPGPMIMACYDFAVTGDVFVTPYGRYTEIYTPSHVFGFYNRTRGLETRGPETVEAYDDWVTELTPASSVDLTLKRWGNAIPWIAGFVPVAVLASLGLCQIGAMGDRLLLPWLSILSLTLVHVPFFYDGVLGWSYLAECTPFIDGHGSGSRPSSHQPLATRSGVARCLVAGPRTYCDGDKSLIHLASSIRSEQRTRVPPTTSGAEAKHRRPIHQALSDRV